MSKENNIQKFLFYTTKFELPDEHKALLEQAQKVLGENRVAGIETIHKLENQLTRKNIYVKFVCEANSMDIFPYSETDLKIAKEENEILTIRPNKLIRLAINDAKKDIDALQILTFINALEIPIAYRTPFILGTNYDLSQSSYRNDNMLIKADKSILNSGWQLIKKEPIGRNPLPLMDSEGHRTYHETNNMHDYQNQLMQKGATALHVRKPSITEALWDSLLYYISTGDILYKERFTLTNTRCNCFYKDFGKSFRVTYDELVPARGLYASGTYVHRSESRFIPYRDTNCSYLIFGKGFTVMAVFPETAGSYGDNKDVVTYPIR